MPAKGSRIQKQLTELIGSGELMINALSHRIEIAKGAIDGTDTLFFINYQGWYTESSAVIRQLLPDRLPEFTRYYEGPNVVPGSSIESYSIRDWLFGIRAAVGSKGERSFLDIEIVANCGGMQLGILRACRRTFKSSLFDIAQIVRADLFNSELDSARELAKNGFLRAAGIVAGVVLEKHLAHVCTIQKVPIKKSDPSISDLNNYLKEAKIVSLPRWRQTEVLADIRNVCGHNKGREPTREEVSDLIDGTDKALKTLM